MSIMPYNADQADALQEVTNVAMGQAGSSLATRLGVFVTLSVPRSRIVEADEVAPAVATMLDDAASVTVVRQTFFGRLSGEALVLFGPQGCADLIDLFENEDVSDDAGEQTLLLDLGSTLVGALLTGLGEQLEADLTFSAPSILAIRQPLAELANADRLGCSHALLVEVNFSLEARGFKCHVLLMMPEESIELMRSVLDELLGEL